MSVNSSLKVQGWLEDLIRNEDVFVDLRPDGYRLSTEERVRIAGSIKIFQLGECSEGHSLRAFADRVGDDNYSRAIRLLIREENRHSAYLASFMRDHGLKKIEKDWSASSFKFFKNLFGLEARLRVLITAEIIALSYYSALSDVTGSPKLKRICSQMLTEETMHVAFQMHSIQSLNSQRTRLGQVIADLIHTGFNLGTAIVVGFEHRSVLQVRFTRIGFIREVMQSYSKILRAGRESATSGWRRTDALSS